MQKEKYTEKDMELLNSKLGLYTLLQSKKINLDKAMQEVKYGVELKQQQEELIKLQNWVIKNDKKLSFCLKGVMRQEKAVPLGVLQNISTQGILEP